MSIEARCTFHVVYTPAMKNGRPVEVWVSVPFEFRLSGDVTY